VECLDNGIDHIDQWLPLCGHECAGADEGSHLVCEGGERTYSTVAVAASQGIQRGT